MKNSNSRFSADSLKLFICGAFITLLLAVFAVFTPSFLHRASNKAYDLMMQALPLQQESGNPAIVGIDDRSMNEYGQWPWPRYILARLLKNIGDQGASAIALDIILPEHDRTSLSVVFKEMNKEWGEKFPYKPPGGVQHENDQVLAEVLRNTRVVLANQFKFNDERSSFDSYLHPLKYSIQEKKPQKKHRILSARSVIHSLPLLTNAAGASGFVNSLTDSDGVVRRVPLVIDYNGTLYPSLTLATMIAAYGNDQVMIENSEDGVFIDWNNRRIPLDSHGYFLVPYLSKDNAFSYVSAADILSERIRPDTLKGRIVFVGVNASGMGDGHLSPLNKMIHGTEIHASIVNSIINGHFLRRPSWAPGAELVLMVVAGLLSSIALAAGGALWSLLFTLMAGLATGAMFYWLFSTQGIFLSPVMPLTALLVNFSVLNTLKYGLEEIKLRKRNEELIQSQDVAILSMSAMTETRNEETGHHILRTQRYVKVLAQRLRKQAKYKNILSDQAIELLYKSAPLHDIGKVGIPDRILLKPDRLSPEEFERMKTHTVMGGQIIQKAGTMLGSSVDFPYLKYAYELAISHHEKWNGSGYPCGLAGEAIPLAGRIMALADVYDALITRRVYKPPFPQEIAYTTILEGRGKHFDPDVVDAFIEEQQTFLNITREFADKA